MENFIFAQTKKIKIAYNAYAKFDTDEINRHGIKALANIMSLGFKVDTMAEMFFKYVVDNNEIDILYNRVMSAINDITGFDELNSSKLFYPGFPNQVKELDEVSLFFNQVIYYITGMVPDGEREEELKAIKDKFDSYRIIETYPSDQEDEVAHEIYRNIISKTSNLSATEARGIFEYVERVSEKPKRYHGFLNIQDIKNRNTLCLVSTIAYMKYPNARKYVGYHVDKLVPADLIKICTFYSIIKKQDLSFIDNNDSAYTDKFSIPRSRRSDIVSILKRQDLSFLDNIDQASIDKFSIPRSMRRDIVYVLNEKARDNCASLRDSISYDIPGFKKLFRILHIGSDKDSENVCENLKRVVDDLHNVKIKSSWKGDLDHALSRSCFSEAFYIMRKHPTEAFKMLNQVYHKLVNYYKLNKADEEKLLQNAINAFFDLSTEIVKSVKTDDLIAFGDFLKRSDVAAGKERMYNVVGCNFIDENKLYTPWTNDDKMTMIKIIYDELCKRFVAESKYKNVYIDSRLKNAPIFKKDAAYSSAASSYPKGTKIEIPEDKKIRAFIWWTNTYNERIDIDLSATVFDATLSKRLASFSFHSEKRDYHNCVVHSGDITDGGPIGGNGASEFIDIDMSEIRNRYPAWKYIIVTSNLFTGPSLNEVPNFGGYAVLEPNDESSLINIDEVKFKSKMTAQKACTMFIIDLENSQLILVNEQENAIKGGCNISDDIRKYPLYIKYILNFRRFTLKDAAKIYAKGNGLNLLDKPNADEDTINFLFDDSLIPDNNLSKVVLASDAVFWSGSVLK